MEKLKFEEEELVFLVLLFISNKENRVVIDSIDLENYRKIIESSCSKNQITIDWNNRLEEQVIQKLDNSVVEFSYQDKKYYSIIPSVTVADLYNDYQRKFSESRFRSYLDFERLENLPKRGIEDQKMFQDITSLIINHTDSLDTFSSSQIRVKNRK